MMYDKTKATSSDIEKLKRECYLLLLLMVKVSSHSIASSVAMTALSLTFNRTIKKKNPQVLIMK